MDGRQVDEAMKFFYSISYAASSHPTLAPARVPRLASNPLHPDAPRVASRHPLAILVTKLISAVALVQLFHIYMQISIVMHSIAWLRIKSKYIQSAIKEVQESARKGDSQL